MTISTPELYWPKDSEVCSEALYRFISEYDLLINSFFFTVEMAHRMDVVALNARKVLDKVDGIIKDDKDYETNTTQKKLYTFSSINSRNLVNNMVDNFLCYLSEIIQLAVTKKSLVLKSKESISYEEILQFGNYKELKSYLIDKKINELSYGGLDKMEIFLDERLGTKMFANEDEKKLLNIFIQLRNIQTHNRGVVNNIFIKRLGFHSFNNFTFKLNKKHHVDFNEFTLLSKNAIDVALCLDKNICTKFSLKRTKYGAKLKKQRKDLDISK